MNGKKILIVEDNREHLLALAIKLKASGFTIVSAEDGASAISVARKELPDLVVLDLGLPAGDGYLVIERLRNLIPTAAIPIIVVSARDPGGNKDRAHKAGALAFFQKPADTDVLLTAIHRVVHRNGSQTA